MANPWVLAVVQALLFGDAHAPDCSKDADPIACLISAKYGKDPKAQALATDLFAKTGDIAALGRDEMMDGGYRGMIHLVPELPIGKYRKHLEWVTAATSALDAFYKSQFDPAKPPSYRWRDLAFRFVRSVGKHTPSAYALIGDGVWIVEYNVEGSLLQSETGVRETLVHELFHVNDEAHGDWSQNHLATDFNAIVKKCQPKGMKVSCLAPFAPNDTKVRATGQYYAFQPNNGNVVHEYAAELAVRYWKEQTEMLANGKLAAPAFKCGPPENGRVWAALVDEFFASVDRTPAC